MMSDCNDPRRTLGITVFPPSIGVPCDCYDEVIFPIPVGLILRAFPESIIKSAGVRLFPAIVKNTRVAALRAKVVSILDRINAINTTIGLINTEIAELTLRLTNNQAALRAIVVINDGLNNRLTTIIQDIASRRISYRNELNYLRALNNSGISSPPLSYDEYINNPLVSQATQNIDRYAREMVWDWNTSPPTLTGGSLADEWRAALNDARQSDQALLNATNEYGPLIRRDQDRIRAQQAEKRRLFSDRDAATQERNSVDGLISQADTTDPEVFGNLVDGITVSEALSIGGILLQSLINIFSATAIVETRVCDGSATLNPDTCMCECDPDQEVCDPQPSDALNPSVYLPRLPGTRTLDEVITCHPKCCGGQVWQPATPPAARLPCACYCPNIPGPGNEQQELKPCSDPNKTDCEDGMLCAQKYPPDIDPSAWFPPPSKYEWSSTECDWVCKDDCPTNQEHGQGCLCFCKSAQDAECFAPYTWRTTSDATTGEAISCECLCLSPSESCGGNCYEECPSGQTRNSSTCACECPAEKETCGDGCYDPCPPDHSRESDCSCSPYTPFMFSSEISTIEW
jgi:hypothetical protein